MKLDVKSFRYLTREDWRVLTAFEQGTKNHEVVPTQLAAQLSGLRTGANGVNKSISTLARAGLVAKVKNAKYDGYRLKYGGLDYLALQAHSRSSAIIQLGSTMGVGKESDILLVTSPAPLSDISLKTASSTPIQSILKIHRLGRTSFRTASNNRSYQGNRHAHCSWQHLSQLSARKEYAAMSMLKDAGFRVPRPIAQNRHTVVMSLVPGMPLRQVPLAAFGTSQESREQGVAALYAELIEVVLSFAERGLIHGDMNEFNVLVEGVPEEYGDEEDDSVKQDGKPQMVDHGDIPSAEDASTEAEAAHPTEAPEDSHSPLTPHIIDFPQITSMSHPQANEFFDRDIRGIKSYFRKRYHFESDDMGPNFEDAQARLETALRAGLRRLDVDIQAAGFDRKAAKELDAYYDDQAREDQDAAQEDAEGSAEVEHTPTDGDHPAEADVDAGTPADTDEAIDCPAEEKVDQEFRAPDKLTRAALAQNMEDLALYPPPSGNQSSRRPKSKAASGWAI